MEKDQVIIKPVLTEKTNELREEENKRYVFRVHPKANKMQIMQAVEHVFGVKPLSCNTSIVKGKASTVVSRSGRRGGTGKKTSWKKAVVTLAANEKIDIFEGA